MLRQRKSYVPAKGQDIILERNTGRGVASRDYRTARNRGHRQKSAPTPFSAEAMRTRFLERLGLGRPELRAWAMYDWANSAFMTTVITAVFPQYFAKVAAAGLPPAVATARFAAATTIALATVALISPVLGAVADYGGTKKRMLARFMFLGVTATAAMFLIGRGQWLFAAALFVAGNIGIVGSFAFYDSLLPHIAATGEIDRVSTAGYALGYIGGGLLLALNLAWIEYPSWFGIRDAQMASRLSFVSVAVWWLVFSIPLFRKVPEPKGTGERKLRAREVLGVAFGQLGRTLHELRRYRQALLMLAAFLLYSDGINTIIRLSSVYGTEIGIGETDMILAFVLVQFVGIPCAFLFGALASRIGAKRAIFLSLVVYVLITIVGYRMHTAAQFYLLAFMVGTVQGGSQALSRSLFATMIPKERSSEFFAFFGVFEKFSGIIGPLVFFTVISLTGASRLAVLSVTAFFIVGAILLSMVNVAEGQRAVVQTVEGSQPIPSS
jgi:UMF1 family MFS transporter